MTTTHAPAPDSGTEPTPAQLLRAAADYLDTHGWCQSSYYDPNADTAYPGACVSGAITIATDPAGLGGNVDLFNRSQDVCDASALLATYLIDSGQCGDPDDAGLEYAGPESVIIRWNDHPGRTVGEVTTALREAADTWDRTHRAADNPAAQQAPTSLT